MSEETTNNSSAPGPGDIIRYARDQRGMAISELADEMRISRGKLQDLESNKFAKVGADTFVRGYLRASARILKLNADDLMAEYEAFAGLGSGAAEVAPVTVEVKERKLAKWQLVVIGLLLLALLAFFISLFFGGDDVAAQLPSEQPQAEQLVVEQKSELDQAAVVIASASGLSPGSIVDGGSLTSSAMAAVKKAPVGVELTAGSSAVSDVVGSVAAEPGTGADFKLLFTFTGLCWLEVRDNSGRRLYSGNKTSGDSLSLNGRGPFQVRLGNASVVSLQVNGDDYPIQARSGSKTLKLMVP